MRAIARPFRFVCVAFAAALALTPARASDEDGFRAWLAGFKAEAAKQGIGAATLERAFAKVHYNARVIELDNHQPEFTKPIWDYIGGVVTDSALRQGRRMLAQHGPLLKRVSARYGVPPEYLLAIWRIESGFGANFGSFSVVESLATLAYAGRRQDFWKTELIAALRLVERGEVPVEKLVGSWAGAMGHTQFMPSGYLNRAVDFDGDGKRDLWSSLPDVFASTANYLVIGGWSGTQPFGTEVRLPEKFPYELAETTLQPVGAWRKLGVTLANGKPLPEWPGDLGILVPAGHKGPAFLLTGNYRAILSYNNAAAYALAVGLFAERLRGGGIVARPWPTDDRMLSRTEKEELQRLLQERGFDPGKIDGQVGPTTRGAIRSFQKKAGLVPDGYADIALLEALRRSPKP
ncbi:MAG: lytic murein transglycosylase [Rhodospirillaceae bacterium]|nr:lytic murein transglycosylase [Rhodospirillaceae bacterium]